MECEGFLENGRVYVAATRKSRVVERQLPNSNARHLRLAVAAAVPPAPIRSQMHLGVVSHHTPNTSKASPHVLPVEHPFINNMDEITYWIYTKRAPCLLNYDNVIARQSAEAVKQCSNSKPISIHSVEEAPIPNKKKKRKLSMLDDDSVSEKLQNVYFDVFHQQNKKTVVSSSKSNTIDSDVDFNIKNSSIRGKCKKFKLQKCSRTTLHKKNKIVTSTPKVTANLRRSLRRAQQNHSNGHLNSSFENFNACAVNGNVKSFNNDLECGDKNKSVALAGRDHNEDSKNTPIANNKKKETIHNGQFEDLSDVSGFTANYIRSTKMTKTPRKLRCKSNRNLMKEGQSGQKDKTTIVCVNKSVNTGLPKPATVMNCSTDSSQNVLNLVTTRNNGKSTRVDKSTSLLKFRDSKANKESAKVDDGKQKSKTNLNVSFQLSTTSRYPKRYKKYSPPEETATNNNNHTNNTSGKKRKISKNSSDFNNSDKKENPEDILISRTRSGRNIGLTLRQPENSVLVFNNSSEQVSSMVSVNVASPTQQRGKTKKKRQQRNSNAKKSLDKIGTLQKDSLLEKSGFAACFSDSEDDNEPLKQRKFFRA